LGNIAPEEILALEALRQGVRGDTLKKAYVDGTKGRRT
jgi:phosphosulfolactate synthase